MNGMEREQDTNLMQGERDHVIIRTSMIGIAANLLLAAFKAAVGLFANSIAVILDAVNNLSDALSSVITIVGTKLAGRKPDKSHPLGYGRVEYLSSMIVAAIVLYAGITSVVESIKKIIHPTAADYSAVSLIIIASAVVVKLILGRYVKKVGDTVKSGSLSASGSDALFDAVLSASVLLSAVIYLLTGVSLEAYVGVVIACFIIKAGIEMMTETLDEILGKRADRELTREIKRIVLEEPEVSGAYDLFLHSYGPERNYGSIHVEIPDTMDADGIDALTRKIASHVYYHTGVILTGIGIYSKNTKNDSIAQMRDQIFKLVMKHKGVIQLHGFFVNEETKTISFDVIIDFNVEDRDALYQHILSDVNEAYPEYHVSIVQDIDA